MSCCFCAEPDCGRSPRTGSCQTDPLPAITSSLKKKAFREVLVYLMAGKGSYELRREFDEILAKFDAQRAESEHELCKSVVTWNAKFNCEGANCQYRTKP